MPARCSTEARAEFLNRVDSNETIDSMREGENQICMKQLCSRWGRDSIKTHITSISYGLRRGYTPRRIRYFHSELTKLSNCQ